MRIGILQPSYLPWLGFLDQMAQSDVFVLYDDVQFSKGAWQNRNRIKTANGVQWLTVPVLTGGRERQLIKDVEIDNHTDWRKAHLKSITQNYSKAPFFNEYIGLFENVYSSEWMKLIDLCVRLIMDIKSTLGVAAQVRLSSSIERNTADRVSRLIEICKTFRADEFIEGSAGKDYLEGAGEREFEQSGIKLIYHDYQHPAYPQLYGEFASNLSIIDLLFNNGRKSLDILTNKKEARA